MPPEEDRATAMGDLHTKFHEDRSSGSRHMLTDKQTDTQTDGLITILCTPPSVTFVNENENGEKQENNEFVNEN